jgi:hypothetical protein
VKTHPLNAPTNNLDLRIIAEVPPVALSGPITVVTPHGNVTSTISFEALPVPISLQITRRENPWELSWNDTNYLFTLEFSTDLVNWGGFNTLISPRRIEGGRTIQSVYLPVPDRGSFRLKPRQ